MVLLSSAAVTLLLAVVLAFKDPRTSDASYLSQASSAVLQALRDADPTVSRGGPEAESVGNMYKGCLCTLGAWLVVTAVGGARKGVVMTWRWSAGWPGGVGDAGLAVPLKLLEQRHHRRLPLRSVRRSLTHAFLALCQDTRAAPSSRRACLSEAVTCPMPCDGGRRARRWAGGAGPELQCLTALAAVREEQESLHLVREGSPQLPASALACTSMNSWGLAYLSVPPSCLVACLPEQEHAPQLR